MQNIPSFETVAGNLVGSGAYSNKKIKLCSFTGSVTDVSVDDFNKMNSYVVCSKNDKGEPVFTVNLAIQGSGEFRHFQISPISSANSDIPLS